MKIEVDNKKLKRICDAYGLDINKALYYTNIVLIPGVGNLYVTLDKDCNVIDVREYENREGNMYNYFEGVYSIFNDDIISDLLLDFNGDLDSTISLGTIIKITDKYSEDYGGRLNKDFNESQRLLISYFTFLRHTMDRYLLHCYRTKSLGYNIPAMEEYIRSFVEMLNNYVKQSVKKNRRPDSHEFASLTGQDIFFLATGNDDIMELLTKCNGYKVHPLYPNAVAPLDEVDEKNSLHELIGQMKGTISEENIQKKKGRRKSK